jgi:hypothetical protein
MKLSQIFAMSIILIATIYSCKKTDDTVPTTNTPVSKIELLAGTSNKQWNITKLYINDTLFPLTEEQLLYTKTYKRDSTFEDTDGIRGKYSISSDGKYLNETETIGGSGTSTYNIINLNSSNLEYRLIYNGTDSLNTRFIFNAK